MAYLVRKSGAPNYSARKHHPSFKSLTLRCRPAKATKLAEVASDVEVRSQALSGQAKG